MEENKTISKKNCRSQRIEENTVRPEEPRYKSQVICGSTSFVKNGQVRVFNVFPDARVGFYQTNLPSMPMKVDEDCETTSSCKKHGEKICV